MNATTINSILMSNRKVKKLNISEVRLNKCKIFDVLMKVVLKFSNDIQQLEMFQCITTCSNMSILLNQLNNTEELLLISITSYDKIQETQGIILKLNIKKLKHLHVDLCTSQIENLLLRLPEGVLNVLIIDRKSNTFLKKIVSMQTNLKKMIVSSSEVSEFVSFKDLKLVHLDIITCVNDNHFNLIINVKTLEVLLLNTLELSANVFAGIGKLINLKELSLYNVKLSQIQELSHIQSLKSLKSLELHDHKEQLMELPLIRMSENLPNIKEIRFNFNRLSNNITHAFLMNCKQLIVMKMTAPATSDIFNDTFNQHGLENLKLEKLTINYGIHNKQLVYELIRKFPNLNKLELFKTNIDDDCLMYLLQRLELKSLVIGNTLFLSTEAKKLLAEF